MVEAVDIFLYTAMLRCLAQCFVEFVALRYGTSYSTVGKRLAVSSDKVQEGSVTCLSRHDTTKDDRHHFFVHNTIIERLQQHLEARQEGNQRSLLILC